MKFLVCSDGSEQADQAVRLAATLAAGCKAEVTLLGISESSGGPDRVLDSLKRGQALLADRKIQAELITKAGDPVAEIVKRSDETHYDLVVIGAVRKGTRGLFWMSSKSYKIIKEIKPPVLRRGRESRNNWAHSHLQRREVIHRPALMNEMVIPNQDDRTDNAPEDLFEKKDHMFTTQVHSKGSHRQLHLSSTGTDQDGAQQVQSLMMVQAGIGARCPATRCPTAAEWRN